MIQPHLANADLSSHWLLASCIPGIQHPRRLVLHTWFPGEHEPDCKPEERQQQWYDWEGHDRGTFVCKRPPGKERTSAEKLDWALKGDESSSWKTAICRKRPKKLATILSISISTQTAPFYESKECIVAGCLAAQCVRQDRRAFPLVGGTDFPLVQALSCNMLTHGWLFARVGHAFGVDIRRYSKCILKS